MQEESPCVYRWDAYMHCFICHEPLFTGPARPFFLGFAPCFCVGDGGAEGEVILLQLLKIVPQLRSLGLRLMPA